VAHLVTVCPDRYPGLVALEPYGFESIQKSLIFRIEQAVRRICQCIRRYTFIGTARFSDSEEARFFLIGLSVLGHQFDGIAESSVGFYPKVSIGSASKRIRLEHGEYMPTHAYPGEQVPRAYLRFRKTDPN
jgi:hypothetical protein